VFFDNFSVTHERGRIIEENHYYAYGLKIAALSSKAQGVLENKFLYNGKELASAEFEDGSGLDWYEYGLREYDAQIGRFFRVDPLTDAYPYLTPYQYAGCEPIANTDLDGAEPVNATVQKGVNDEVLRPLATRVDGKLYVDAYHQGLQEVRVVGTRHNLPPMNSFTNGGSVQLMTSLNLSTADRLNIDIDSKCHLSNREINFAQAIWWQKATENLDHAHGQVMPPRGWLIDLIGPERTVLKDGVEYDVTQNGYVGKKKLIIRSGTPPVVGFGGIYKAIKLETQAVGLIEGGAKLTTDGVRLNQHLAQLEQYGAAGFKELQNGRFRYYRQITKATNAGEMIGRRLVREWNPMTGLKRTWMETLDGAGRVRIVRPQIGGFKTHYMFDQFGKYVGKW
jgi:RHS repeat-associated protein